MAIIGHESVRQALEAELPTVSLLIGPAHVGKSTLAHHVLQHHGVWPVDIYEHELTARSARDMRLFAQGAPSGSLRVILTRLPAGEPVWNILLTALEAPPPTTRFILLAQHHPSPTITSRSQIFLCGYLPLKQVTQILIDLGMSTRSAAAAAALTPGTVPSGEIIVGYEAARENVLGLAQAIAAHDQWLFHRVCQSSDGLTRALLYRWLHEAATGNWRIFTEAETYGMAQQKTVVRKMILALGSVTGVRDTLAIRVAIEPFVEEEH
jgi:hypothetical protein